MISFHRGELILQCRFNSWIGLLEDGFCVIDAMETVAEHVINFILKGKLFMGVEIRSRYDGLFQGLFEDETLLH